MLLLLLLSLLLLLLLKLLLLFCLLLCFQFLTVTLGTQALQFLLNDSITFTSSALSSKSKTSAFSWGGNEAIMIWVREKKRRRKQSNKQTNKQTNKQANKQTNKQTSKQTKNQNKTFLNPHLDARLGHTLGNDDNVSLDLANTNNFVLQTFPFSKFKIYFLIDFLPGSEEQFGLGSCCISLPGPKTVVGKKNVY